MKIQGIHKRYKKRTVFLAKNTFKLPKSLNVHIYDLISINTYIYKLLKGVNMCLNTFENAFRGH